MINTLKGLFLYHVDPCIGPAIDLYETAEALVFEIDLPGADLLRLSLSVYEDMLIVQGEPPDESDGAMHGGPVTYLCMERSLKGFRRVVKLPVLVNTLEAEAWYRNGVLTITFPKLKGKLIKIAIEKKGN